MQLKYNKPKLEEKPSTFIHRMLGNTEITMCMTHLEAPTTLVTFIQCGWHWIPQYTKHCLPAVWFSQWDNKLQREQQGRLEQGKKVEVALHNREENTSLRMSQGLWWKGQMGCCFCLCWQPHFSFTSQHPPLLL